MSAGHRVLMIAPTPFFADRGCHVRILGEIRALQEEGCEVTLCTYHHGRDISGVRTVRIPRIPWYTKLEAGPSHHKYYADILLLWRSLFYGLRNRPDVIHAHLHEGCFIGLFLRAALRRPLIFDYQGSLTDELAAHDYADREGPLLKAMKRLEQRIDRGADLVISSTDRSAEALRDRLGAGGVATVLDGVDTSVFRPIDSTRRREIRKRFNIPSDSTLAVFVGVLTPYQGIDLLLENVGRALAHAPNLHVLIVGFPEGDYRKRATELGLADRITFTGKVPFEETPELTAAADIALTPKVSLSEGNLKIYNYLACGLPVVAFDSPANREILGELGVYAPFGDGTAFADAIAGLANEPERCAALGSAGRELATERLSWRRAAREIVAVYERAGSVPRVESARPAVPARA